MQILQTLTEYAETGKGDVKALEGKFSGTHRLRVGNWRSRFRKLGDGTVHVLAVENRGEAY
jgi:mRNA-degrading endonuclease RelE of RelBE toxin-antitoxin system